MPIITTFRVPSIGLETDHDNILRVETEQDYEDVYFDSYTPASRFVRSSITTIYFKDGTLLKLGGSTEAQIEKRVELVEGRIYQVSENNGQKWLALCKPDYFNEGLVLAPITYVPGAQGFSVEDKDKYQFHKEFDLDLKEYL